MSEVPANKSTETMEYQLPSSGYPYCEEETGESKIPHGIVNLSPIDGWAEGVLQNNNFTDHAKGDKIIAACAHLPTGVDHRDLIVADRMLLLLGIRTHTYGPEYLLSAECNVCEHAWMQVINLVSDIDCEGMPRKHVVTKTDGTVTEETCVYKPWQGIPVKLPKSGLDLTLRMLTGRDDAWIMSEVAKKNSSAFVLKNIRHGGDPAFFMRVARMIRSVQKGDAVEIVNHSDPQEFQMLFGLVGKLHALDLAKIRKEYERYDVAVTSVFVKSCPMCGKEVAIPFRMTPEMFRPSNI